MLIALYITIGLLTYFVVAGFTHRAAEMSHRSKCGRCSEKQGGSTCSKDPDIAWFFIAVFCIFVLPAALGMKIYGENKVKMSRQERKHAKELRQAEHMSKLAVFRLKEAEALQQASELTEPHNILNLLSKT